MTSVRHSVSQDGVIQYTTPRRTLQSTAKVSSSFRMQTAMPFLTRAGSFVPDAEGSLVNSAGFYLVGYSYENGEPSVDSTVSTAWTRVIARTELQAVPSTEGVVNSNLPGATPIATGTLPSSNRLPRIYRKVVPRDL